MASDRPPFPRTLLAWSTLLASVAAVLCVRPVREPDPLWHMTLGRAVLGAGSRTAPEPTSYLGLGEPRVVPEWLWGVLTLGLHEAGGWTLLQLWLSVIAALVAIATVWLLWRLIGPRTAPVVLTSGLVLAQVLGRIRLRPHAASLVLVPVTLLLSLVYRDASGRARWWWGGALVLVEVVWAQIHGSFVLVPALVAATLVPDWIRRRDRPRDVADGVLLVALACGLLTSAYGANLGHYLADHAAGDAAAYVSELASPDWGAFHPLKSLYGPLYVALWGLGLAGILRARRPWWTELAWALLGLALYASAVRFVGTASLLLAPLAARGLAELTARSRRRGRLRWIAVILALLVLGRFGVRVHQRIGPLGQVGLAEGAHPLGAVSYLAAQPAGAHVFGELTVGPSMAFFLGDHVTTSVDTRTPLHFDDTEYGLARDALVHPDAALRTLQQHRANLAVVYRTGSVCETLATTWVPVVVEPRFSSFVPPGSTPPLEVVAPCGVEYLSPDPCRGGGAALERDLQRLAALGESPFLDYLRAEAALRCAGRPDEAEDLLPPHGVVREYPGPWDRARARVHLGRGELDDAIDILERDIQRGDLADLSLVAPALIEAGQLDDARELLEAFTDVAADATPPDVRADLAWVCSQQGDAECVRFHGLRAAGRGSLRASEPLRWLVENHPDEATRQEAAGWLAQLEGDRAPR